MKRTLPRLLGVFVIAVFTNTTVKAVPHTTINGATNPAPYVIAVLSDHYTDKNRFDNDVNNFIKYGLLAHSYYAGHKADLQIESFYEPLTAAKSNYGFDVDVPSTNCVLSWDESTTPSNTTTLVSDAVKDVNPRHTIVIGDHPYNFGCTNGEWTYVARSAVGSDVLPHEMGHAVASLYDEWFPSTGAGYSHPGLPLADGRNCYDTRHGATPPWTLPGAGSVPGCDLFQLNVVHAYPALHGGKHYCLMGATNNAEFCPVCAQYMDEVLGSRDLPNPDADNPDVENPDLENPDIRNPAINPGTRPKPLGPATNLRIIKTAFVMQPPPLKPVPVPAPLPPIATLKPGTVQPIVRLLVSFDPTTGVLTPRKAVAITGRYVPDHRRLGGYVYEIADGNATIDVGVFPSRLFQSRSYQGGAAHQTSGVHAADVTIQIPVATSLLKDPAHAIVIRMYRLAPNVSTRLITPAALISMRGDKQAQLLPGEVTAAQILAVMSAP